MTELYYVCRLHDEDIGGTWEGLRSTTDKGYAEQLYDYYCTLYPQAYIDILTYDEYHDKGKQVEMMIR